MEVYLSLWPVFEGVRGSQIVRAGVSGLWASGAILASGAGFG
jgi:hypothetical protein